MLNNNEIKDRVHAARYVPGARFEKKLTGTLDSIKEGRNMKGQREISKIAAAAALILFIAMAAPPIVRAASPLIERMFGRIAEKEEAYLSMSEEEQSEKELSERLMYVWGHDLDVTAEAGGATVSLLSVMCYPEDAYDDTSRKGSLSLEVSSSKRPSFYAVKIDGKEHKLNGEDAESIAYTMGETTDYPSFAIDNWKFETATEVVFMGAIGKDKFEIPFTFDPEKALEQARADVAAGKDIYLEMSEERLKRLKALDDIAIPVGIQREVAGMTFTVSEIAISEDGMFNVGWAVDGVTEKNPKIAQLSCSINETYVDGYPLPWAGGSDGEVEGETVILQEYKPFARNADNLPDTSLIVMNLACNEQSATVAFRVNWREKTVVLPKDEAEENAWITENDVLKKTVQASAQKTVVIDLKPRNLVCAQNGYAMTLTRLNLSRDDSSAEIEFEILPDESFDFKEMRIVDNWGPETESTLMVNGKRAVNGGGTTYSKYGSFNSDLPFAKSFILPCHLSEIDEGTEIAFECPLTIYRGDEKVGSMVFRFEFGLDGLGA